MKIMLLILIVLSVTLVIPFADAVPKLDRERAYEKADFIFYGEVLSLDVLSESIQTQDKNSYRETNGKVIYSIKIHDFIKNSFDDQIISAHGEYLEKPHGMSYTPSLYKIGDNLVFYVHTFNENESSYDYLIDSAASHKVPSECKYDFSLDYTDKILDIHSCTWEKITTDENVCGPGTQLVDNICEPIRTTLVKVHGDEASPLPFIGLMILIFGIVGLVAFLIHRREDN